MANIVLGLGVSHSPMLSTPPDLWRAMGEDDKKSRSLVDQDTGEATTYRELLAKRGNTLHPIHEQIFHRQWEACQEALRQLSRAILSIAPDVLVIVSADQCELLFEENMPMLQIFWGEKIRLIPRFVPAGASPVTRAWSWGYGDVEMDIPVESDLARHLLDHFVENGIDVAHSRYLRAGHMYGGTVGPCGFMREARFTPPKPQGIGHGWGFIVRRLLENRPIPIVPVIQNATFPPNRPTPRRCLEVGRAIRAGIESWKSDKKVCVIASGGLSHFVTDEKLDNLVLQAIVGKNTEALQWLPCERLNSASGEIRNWVTVAAACENLSPNLVDYVPVYRTEGGTGGGWAFMEWT